jgi:hypothetical protein
MQYAIARYCKCIRFSRSRFHLQQSKRDREALKRFGDLATYEMRLALSFVAVAVRIGLQRLLYRFHFSIAFSASVFRARTTSAANAGRCSNSTIATHALPLRRCNTSGIFPPASCRA